MRDEKNLISVIVPVYNVEKYLSFCIASIIAQTYKNWELILVDDGSTDGSGIICDEYSKKDNRIKIIHKQNAGVSAARNMGILAAQGDFVFFIDSDDYLDADTFSELIKTNDKYDVGGTFCGIKYVFENGSKEVKYVLPTCKIDISETLNDFFEKLYNGFCFHAACGKLFKKNIIIDNKISFEEKFSILEDCMFVSDYLRCCNSFVIAENVFYNYRQIETDSLMKKFNKNAIDALEKKYNKDAFLRQQLNEENKIFYYKKMLGYLWGFILQIYTRSDYSMMSKKILLSKYLSNTIVKEISTFIRTYGKTSKKEMIKCTFLNANSFFLHALLSVKHFLK